MIDVMAIQQSYEQRELQEIRWINGADNLADATTKASPNKALETFITTNEAKIRVEGWVSRHDSDLNGQSEGKIDSVSDLRITGDKSDSEVTTPKQDQGQR